MQCDFFVMLTTQSGGYTPLMDKGGDEMAKFETAELAKDCAENNPVGKSFGYEVFEIGFGVYRDYLY